MKLGNEELWACAHSAHLPAVAAALEDALLRHPEPLQVLHRQVDPPLLPPTVIISLPSFSSPPSLSSPSTVLMTIRARILILQRCMEEVQRFMEGELEMCSTGRNIRPSLPLN
jgi:hypothetical protein